MGVPRTAVGIFSAAIAKRAFEVARDNKEDPKTWVKATAVGSVAGAVAYHSLKPEAEDIIRMIHGNSPRKLLTMSD